METVIASEATISTVKQFGESLGKTVIMAKDTPGFIVNRLLVPYVLDAVRMLESGTATKEDIDAGMKLGANYPIGPLALIDLMGLDTTCFVASAMYEQLKDPKFAPPILLSRMVMAGLFGRKVGKGFYSYE